MALTFIPAMAYTLVIIGFDPNNRLVDVLPPQTGPLYNLQEAGMTGCSDCRTGNKLLLTDKMQLGATDAAEMYVLKFPDKAEAQSWIDSWPSPSKTFAGKLVYAMSPTFPQAPAVEPTSVELLG